MQSGSTWPTYQPIPVKAVKPTPITVRPARVRRGTSIRAVSAIMKALITACRITTGHRLQPPAVNSSSRE